MADQNPNAAGLQALHRLKSIEAPQWLAPSPELSQSARSASQYLFSTLLPFCPKSPLGKLLVDGFDAEQIWQQIDLQTQSLVSNLRRDVKKFEKNPGEVLHLFGNGKGGERKGEKGKEENLKKDGGNKVLEDEESQEFDDDDDAEEEEEEEEEEEQEQKEQEEEEDFSGNEIEDEFFKTKELEDFMEKAEEEEFGIAKEKRGNRNTLKEDDEEEEDEDDEDEEEDDEIGGFDGLADGGEGDEDFDNIRYEDFYGGQKRKSSKKSSKSLERSEGLENSSEDMGSDDVEEDDEDLNKKDNGKLSTHEKQLEKVRSKIEQMEKANLEPKSWTMQGEVTAAKRPKNSALEVDLDFEHNVRPAPVITEEVTASLEELIKKRIIEGHFDDVQKAPSLPSKAPKELKELDEKKSQKGLAEIYEEDYVQKTGLSSAPLSSSDEQKKEASLLFKKLCLKLDALSHFHFTPKPIIEDMSVQANVPALAMEEIAPLAVSDAAMLAPEEVFSGKGDIKEAAELTQAERKQRRANKKRKFKAEATKRMAAKKSKHVSLLDLSEGPEES